MKSDGELSLDKQDIDIISDEKSKSNNNVRRAYSNNCIDDKSDSSSYYVSANSSQPF